MPLHLYPVPGSCPQPCSGEDEPPLATWSSQASSCPPSPTGSSFSLGCPPSSPCPHTCPLGDHSLATPNEAGHSYWVDFLRASSVLPFYEWTMSYVIVSLLSCSHSTLDCKLPIDGDSVFTFKPSPPHSEQMPSQGQTHGGGLGVGEWLSAFLDSPSRKACGVVPF